jgi:hypothetical protein
VESLATFLVNGAAIGRVTGPVDRPGIATFKIDEQVPSNPAPAALRRKPADFHRSAANGRP